MAAIAAVFDQLPAGSIVALPDDCYQGVAGLAAAGVQRGRWSIQRIALDDTAGWIRACAQADLVWLESPSNPLLGVADLQAICAAPRRPGAIVAVDNTFATPLNQRPLDFGASVSLHSAMVLAERLERHATSLGAVESAMERRAAIPGQEHLPPALLRLSVGIEDVGDLRRDLEGAMTLARPDAHRQPSK